MAQALRALRIRPVLVTIHRWTGLVAGIWLFIAAATGAILVFSDELDRVLNPEYLVAKPGEVVSLDRVALAVENGFPGYYASSINVPNAADENFTIFTKPLDKNSPAQPSVQIFVDARTGDVLGSRDRGADELTRLGFTRLVTKIHYTLLAKDVGKWLFGLITAVWCIGHLIGLVIAFPKLKRWKSSFTIPFSAKGFKFNFQAHRAISLWMFPATLIISFTALYLNWGDYFRSAVNYTMDLAEPFDKKAPQKPDGFQPSMSLQSAMDLVERSEYGVEVDGVSILKEKGLYRFRVFDHRDIDKTTGQRHIYVDSEAGIIAADEHVASSQPGNIFLAWQFPLHSGKVFGWTGRIAVLLAGLATCYIIATGYLMYFKRRSLQAEKRAGGAGQGALDDDDETPPFAGRISVKRPASYVKYSAIFLIIAALVIVGSKSMAQASGEVSAVQGEGTAKAHTSDASSALEQRLDGRELVITLAARDAESEMATKVVDELKAEPAFADVRFVLFPWRGATERDVAAMAQSDIAFVSNMGLEIAQAVQPAVAQMAERGAKAYAFGGAFEAAEADAGMTEDAALLAYGNAGGKDNWKDMIRFAMARDFGMDLPYNPPVALPLVGLWDWRTGQVYTDFEDYKRSYLAARPASAAKQPFVAIFFNRGTAVMGKPEEIYPIATALERRGLNVVTAFSYPSETALERLLTRPDGGSFVDAVVAISFKFNNVPERTVPLLQKAGVPLINAIGLLGQTEEEWRASPVGIPMLERSHQIASPEFAGILAPTVYAGRREQTDSLTGLPYVASELILEQVEKLAERASRYVRLRTSANSNKSVAVVYYNSPAGKENIGASYLNVLPHSLWNILQRMRDEGYDVGNLPDSPAKLNRLVQSYGVNIASWDQSLLNNFALSGHAQLVPLSDYTRWFKALDPALQSQTVKDWGEVDAADIMVWKNPRGEAYLVMPGLRFGKVFVGPQPARGRDEAIHAAFADDHDHNHSAGEAHLHNLAQDTSGNAHAALHTSHLMPHHQYLAFYLWLQHDLAVDAMVHVGTHATHEWLPGKEVGLASSDPSDAIVGVIPQLYPYIMDDIGEGLQAKRRGMAALISHLTPPFDAAGLSPELRELAGLIGDLQRNLLQSPAAVEATLADLNGMAAKLGILHDIGVEQIKSAEDADALSHYLDEIGSLPTPYGLHSFGVSPAAEARRTTADAILSLAEDLSEAEREQELARLEEALAASGPAELDALIAGLAGQYIAAGPGNDPIRNPDALPTGRNMYGFDPTRMPTRGTWEQGQKLADRFIAEYRDAHDGAYPDRVSFTLWSVEAMRHEGALEAQIMALMGVKPHWNSRGKIEALKVIPQEELGRPRVDVTLVPSGLYRDSLPDLMLLFDSAISQLLALDEPASVNPIKSNWENVRQELLANGMSEDLANRMAAVRIFTEPPGAYGTGVETMTNGSNLWSDESEVADVYFSRVGHLFGQGFWGEQPEGAEAAIAVFKKALSGSKAVLHSNSSNLYGVLDNDDVFQYLGATAMAVRQIDGTTPDTLIVNLNGPNGGTHESIERFLSREMRSRYLDPKWIQQMLNEGYAGARFVTQTVNNLWGWEVIAPDAVDDSKWQAMYETYVMDKHGLGIEQRFRESGNLRALQAVTDRMLSVIAKGYWDADQATADFLEQTNDRLIEEAGTSCSALNCSSARVLQASQEWQARMVNDAQDSARVTTPRGISAPTLSAPLLSAQQLLPSASTPRAPQGSTPVAAPAAPSPSVAEPSGQDTSGTAGEAVMGRAIETVQQALRDPSKESSLHPYTFPILAGFLAVLFGGFFLSPTVLRRT